MSAAGFSTVALDGGATLAELAQATGGRLVGGDVRFETLCTDTRDLAPGALFVALRGPHHDAHAFLAEARARGAGALLAERADDAGLPAVLVDDTRAALGRFAAWWRARFAVPVAAITGSNGKTTVKEMLACILAARGEGVVTRGNLNNEIGAPLTLLGLGRRHRYAVIEMGARGPGDIAWLTAIARPDVAVVTNAAPSHLAGFGDIAGVVRAKGEIFSGLGADGIAVVNDDDPRVGLWRVMAGERRVIGFALRHPADVTARALRPNPAPGCSFELCLPGARAQVDLRVPGRHNVMNALAAAALAHALGAPVDDIVSGLGRMRGVERRLQLRAGIGGARVIDDSYNANPASVKAALEVLATCGAGGEKILVLGDMGELGNASQALHEQIGRQARAVGVGRLFAVGELAHVAAGMFGPEARHYPDHDALAEALRGELRARAGEPTTVLVKGSRSMRMERIVDSIAVASGGDGVVVAGGPGAGGPAASGWQQGRGD